MKEIIETVVENQAEVAQEVIPEVIEKTAKFTGKDAGILTGLLIVGGLAVYGTTTLVKKHVMPKFAKKRTFTVVDADGNESVTVLEDEDENNN